jgi:hypothetical protein
MLHPYLTCAALAFVGPRSLLAPRPPLARSPIITALADVDLDAQLDALTQKLEILQLKAQLAELQRSAAAATSAGATTIVQAAAPVSPAEPIAAAVQAVVTAPAAVDSAAQVAAAQAAAEPVVAQVVAAPEAIQAVVAAAAATAQPSSLPFGLPFGLPTDGGVPTLALAAVLVPTVAFGGKLFIDFVEQRYAELKSSEAPGDADARARSFAPPSAGNLAANRRWSEREAAAEAERASSWVSSPGGRSATEIVAKGLTNLAEDPIGWLFGEPSPLYSNVAVARPLMATPPPARPMPPAAAASAMEAPPALAVEASALAVEAPPFEGRVVPTPALAARSARRQRREGAGEGFGSRTGAGAGASPSASASASRPARVPPSTPEEVEAARRGEWDYGQFK